MISKAVFVPGRVGSTHTLFITISAAGDTHGGTALLLSCNVDGTACNPGTGGDGGAPAGWINVLKMPAIGLTDSGADTLTTNCGDGGGGSGDCHDNGIYYTWCKNVTSGLHTVEVRFASKDGSNLVFIEAAHFYVDVAKLPIGGGCIADP